METMGQDTQHQVWQRVLAAPVQQPREDLRGLEMTARELAEVYRKLAGMLTGRKQELAKRLLQGELENAAAIKGISRISGVQETPISPWKPEKEPARRHLEKCYYQTRKCMEEYTARSLNAEFGTVFQQLARREEAHCLLIVQLLGLLEP